MIQFALTSLIFLGFQILLVLGLNVQFGLTGILNLAFIIFYAAGAYTAGVMTAPPPVPPGLTYIGGWSLPFYWGITGAVVVAGILSALVGGLALSRRLRGSYTAITTLVVAVVALQVVSQSQGLFDGSLGLLGVPLPFGRGLEQLSLRVPVHRVRVRRRGGVCARVRLAAALPVRQDPAADQGRRGCRGSVRL